MLVGTRRIKGELGRLTVSLVKPIFPDEDVDVDVSQVEGKVRITLRLRSADLLKLILDRPLSGFDYPRIDLPAVPAGYDALSPRVRSPWETERLAGSIPVTPPAGCAAKLFPCCVEWLGKGTVAEMARLSAVIGMEWPGLHSLLARAVLEFPATPPSALKPNAGELSYRIVHADPHHAFTGLEVAAANFSARLEAFSVHRRSNSPRWLKLPAVSASQRSATMSSMSSADRAALASWQSS